MKYFILLLSLLPVLVRADAVYTEHLTVQGNTCIGTDCAIGQASPATPLKLRENNLRIRLQDTGSPTQTVTLRGADYYLSSDQMGDSWNLNANESRNGGANYFGIEQSSDLQVQRLSDGTAVNYTCYFTGTTVPISGEANKDQMDITVDGTLPEGAPWEDPYCATVSEPVIRNGLRFTVGTTDLNGGVALGFGARTQDATVSVGNGDTPRRLIHLAKALADIDVLTVAQMDAYADQKALLDELEEELDQMEQAVTALETSAANNPTPNLPSLKNGGSLPVTLLIALSLLLAPRLRRR